MLYTAVALLWKCYMFDLIYTTIRNHYILIKIGNRVNVFGAIQVLRNADGGGGGVSDFPGKNVTTV